MVAIYFKTRREDINPRGSRTGVAQVRPVFLSNPFSALFYLAKLISFYAELTFQEADQ
jgi:hypothetical protein